MMMERSKKRSLHQRFPRSDQAFGLPALFAQYLTLAHQGVHSTYINSSDFTICTSYGYLYTSGSVRIEESKYSISLHFE